MCWSAGLTLFETRDGLQRECDSIAICEKGNYATICNTYIADFGAIRARTSDSLSERTLRDAQRPFGQEGSLPSHDNLAHGLKPETGDSNKGGIKSELPNRVADLDDFLPRLKTKRGRDRLVHLKQTRSPRKFQRLLCAKRR